MSNKLFTVVTAASVVILSACESNNVKPDVSAPKTQPSQQAVATPATPSSIKKKTPVVSSRQYKEESIKPKKITKTPTSPAPNVKAGSDPRMAFASNLVYRSTAAKQIEKSNDPEAKKLHKKAKSLYQQALNESDHTKSKILLDKALKNMFAATQKADPGEVHAEKSQKDFLKKQKSVTALLDAHKRVAKEKNKHSQGKQVGQQINQLLAKANNLYQQGQYGQGKGILDGALNIVKASIEEMRGGDTLVKTLKFNSPQDEYVYELDRNDTHRMLIKVLLKEKRQKSPDLDKRVREALAIADNFRNKAEQSAQSGNHKKAVEFLELSTKEMVKVIRRGGIYIPSA